MQNDLFWQYLIYAFAGHAIHFLKLFGESQKRNEGFVNKSLLINEAIHLISMPLLIKLLPELPPTWFVMSNGAAVIIGVSASSILSGFINLKTPKDLPGDSGSGK